MYNHVVSIAIQEAHEHKVLSVIAVTASAATTANASDLVWFRKQQQSFDLHWRSVGGWGTNGKVASLVSEELRRLP